MKEFQSTTGGRHVYNADFKNLQELALAMQELFRECGGNFVISGCNVTESGSTLSVSSGYVYIDGKVRFVNSASNLSKNNLFILAVQKAGETIPYADGNMANQYIEYYAEIKNTPSVNTGYIAYNSASKAFPNLATMWFNHYAVCKLAGQQSINDLTVQQTLTTSRDLNATNGVNVGSTNSRIFRQGTALVLKVGEFSYVFGDNGSISVKQGNNELFSFSNTSGDGRVTFRDVVVEEDLTVGTIYLNGVDIDTRFVPVGTIMMWAGTSVPNNYLLCNGQAVQRADYPALFSVLGTAFNTGAQQISGTWTAPGTTQFRVPDLRGRFIVGWDSTRDAYRSPGKTGGEDEHLLKANEMPSHSHDLWIATEDTRHSDSGSRYTPAKTIKPENQFASSEHWQGVTNSTGGYTPHENRPPFYTLAYIIKAK